MAIELPKKHKLGSRVDKKDLKGAQKTKYDKYYEEKKRRKDVTAAGVAQEALDTYYELQALDQSPSAVWTVYGYSIEHVLKPALAEERRVVAALRMGPSVDIISPYFSDEEVQTTMKKFDITEYVEPVVEDVTPE